MLVRQCWFPLTWLCLHQEQEGNEREPRVLRPDPMSMSFLTSTASVSPRSQERQEAPRQPSHHSRSPRSQSPFGQIPIKKEHTGEREWDKLTLGEGREGDGSGGMESRDGSGAVESRGVESRGVGVESRGPFAQITFSQMLKPGQMKDPNDQPRSMAKGTRAAALWRL